MSGADLSGLNAGYVAQMLEAYLDAPASVSQEWRDLFERDPAAYTGSLPGLAGLLQQDGTNGGSTASPSACSDRRLPLPLRRPPRPPSHRQHPLRSCRARAAPEPPLPPPTPHRHRRRCRGPNRRRGGRHRGRRGPPRRRRRCDGARQGLPDARAPRGPARPARLRADGRPGARRVSPRPVPDARAAGAHPGLLAPPLRRRATRCSRRCRSSEPSTRARSRTRSSTSPTTPSGSGSGRRSSRGASGSRSTRRNGRRSSSGFRRPRASSSTCDGRFSGRSSSRSRASSHSCRCSTRRSGSPRQAARTRS